MGENITIPDDVVKNIKPTLRKVNDTKGSSTNTKAKGLSSTKSAPKKSAPNPSTDQSKPTPAKYEDCVFQVTAENFQKVVLDSPVPVLVDVYADWCGPCKQLGPMLENAAMKSGGMFRLAYTCIYIFTNTNTLIYVYVG